jgi:hypothetical protein
MLLAATAATLLAGCEEKAVVAVDPCRPPNMSTTQPAGSYAGEADRTSICVKQAVYKYDRAGGPVEAAAQSAVADCAAQEKAEIKALAKDEKVYPWEKDQIHEKLQHLALLSARQDRARGCGRPGGEPEPE